MPFMPSKEATMRYRKTGMPALIVMIGTNYLVKWYFEHHQPGRPLGIALALLPPLSVILLGVSIMQFLNADRDEVQIAYRRHAVAWATGGTLAVCLIWNGLGVYHYAGETTPGMVFPIFAGFLIVALVALKRRYQ